MKKFLAILICLSLLVGGAFAQITPTVTGDATLSWGIDFGGTEITHGFHNGLSLTIRLPLVAETSFTGGSESQDADVYVEFTTAQPNMSTFSYRNSDGKLNMTQNGGKTTAALHFFGAYITVWDVPDFSADYASAMKTVFGKGNSRGYLADGFNGWGTKIGYANEDILGLDVGLKVGSNKTWNIHDGSPKEAGKEDGTARSAYALGLDFGMKPVEDYLILGATVNAILSGDAGTYKSAYAGNPYVNFGVKVGSTPVEGLDLTVGFDGEYNGGFDWEVGFDTTYKWANLGLIYNKTNGLDMGVGFHTSSKNKLPEPVENLGLHVGVNFYDLLNFGTTKMVDFGIGVDYKLNLSDSMTLTPKAKFALANKADQMKMAYEVGVDYSPMEKVIVGLNWNQGYIEDAKDMYTYDSKLVTTDLRNHKGTLVLSLTLEY